MSFVSERHRPLRMFLSRTGQAGKTYIRLIAASAIWRALANGPINASPHIFAA